MTRILAIDPGTTQSGWVNYCGGSVVGSGVMDNVELISHIRESDWAEVVATEMVASYGMAVGAETFRTVWWTGRFADAWLIRSGRLPVEIFRKDVKLLLCGTYRAKDANIRQALIDLIGPQGKKAAPGPTYGVTSHAWAALAVAVTAAHQLGESTDQDARLAA